MSEPKLLNGKSLAKTVLEDLKDGSPTIAIVLVGDDDRSKTFIELKEKAIKRAGGKTRLFHYKRKDLSEYELLTYIKNLGQNKSIDGILVQLPLPEQFDELKVFNAINPEKDVDGLNPTNLGNLMLGGKTVVPCTVKAIMKLLEDTPLEGKHIVIISRSNLIGKPLAMALLHKSATVTVCHSKTRNLKQHTLQADIIVTATGKPKMLTADMIKKDAVIIDAGYAILKKRVSGDADFQNVKDKVSAITPVPGGVGPLTVAMVVANLFELSKSKPSGRMRVVWFSANDFGWKMLREAVKLDTIEIVAIFTLSSKATTVMYDGVDKERWYEFGIPVYRVERINEKTNLIKSLKPDLIVEAGWRQIISNEILEIPLNGTVGFHPTLLPHGRGPAPIINTILEGTKESGVTLFYLCDRVDAGDIIGQEMFTVEDTDYASDVYRKVVESGRELVQKYLPLLAKGKAPRFPQDEASATFFKKRSLRENKLTLAPMTEETPEKLLRKIRALSKPYKGAWMRLGSKRLIIWRAELE